MIVFQKCFVEDFIVIVFDNRIVEEFVFNGYSNGVNGYVVFFFFIFDVFKIIIICVDFNVCIVFIEVEVNFGNEIICIDYMIIVFWIVVKGWVNFEFKFYGFFFFMFIVFVFYYVIECFEGFKVFCGYDGKFCFFCFDCNVECMFMFIFCIFLLGFDFKEFEKFIEIFMFVDGLKWFFKERVGFFLYICFVVIGIQFQFGVQVFKEVFFFIIVSFMLCMDLFEGGMKLYINFEDMICVWVGGFGYVKVGVNYGFSLLVIVEVRSRGFGQILWLYGFEGYCIEVGVSNFFMFWRIKEGQFQFVMVLLDDKLILDGVMRCSVVQFVWERLVGELEVVERKYIIDEVFEVDKEGRIVEVFVVGIVVCFFFYF